MDTTATIDLSAFDRDAVLRTGAIVHLAPARPGDEDAIGGFYRGLDDTSNFNRSLSVLSTGVSSHFHFCYCFDLLSLFSHTRWAASSFLLCDDAADGKYRQHQRQRYTTNYCPHHHNHRRLDVTRQLGDRLLQFLL